MSHIFKILFQTGDINIFVLRGVFFSRYVQRKSSLSEEKHSSGEIWDVTHFCREAIFVEKENSIIGRSWSSPKLFIVQNYTENGNRDVPLILENVWYI